MKLGFLEPRPAVWCLNRSAFCGCANAMRHAMQRGFRNGTECSPPAGLVLWQDAAVNHEKNESARSQRRRPSHRVSRDRFPLSHVNSGQRLWLLCSMRVGNSAFRGISTPSAGINGRHDPQNAWTGRLVTPQYPSIAFPPPGRFRATGGSGRPARNARPPPHRSSGHP